VKDLSSPEFYVIIGVAIIMFEIESAKLNDLIIPNKVSKSFFY
jgi:hypothetical protein